MFGWTSSPSKIAFSFGFNGETTFLVEPKYFFKIFTKPAY